MAEYNFFKSFNIACVILMATNHGVGPSAVFNYNEFGRVTGAGDFDVIVGNTANYTVAGNTDHIAGAPVPTPGDAVSNPSPSPSPTPTPTPTPDPTPTSTPPPLTGHCTPPNYSACGYPDATNTGVPAGTPLTNVSGDCVRIITPNTVIDGQHITGCIQVEANNVTIQNSVITSSNFYAIQYGRDNPSVTGLKVLHTTFDTVPNCHCDYTIQPLSTGSFEFGWNHINGYRNGIDINTGYLHDNYVHGIVQGPTDHTQAIYVWAGGEGVQMVHNTLIANSGSTASIYYTDDSKRVARGANGYSMDNNWLAGGNFAIYGGSDTSPTKVTITNNRFSTELLPNSGAYDIVVNFNRRNPGNAWYGNTWALGPKDGKHAGYDFGTPTPTPSPSDTSLRRSP